MELLISIFFWGSLVAWNICFIMIKVELQAANPDKDYMLRRHFSIWSDFPELISKEKDHNKRHKFRIKYKFFNISTVALLVSLLLFIGD